MPKRVIPADTPEFLAREGLDAIPAPWEDGLRADTGPGNFEWWYFDAHFEDGSTAVVVFNTKPIVSRMQPLTPQVYLTITRPDGSKLSEAAFYPTDEFSASTERCAVRIGPNRVEGGLARYALHAQTASLAADLVFEGIVPPWRPGAGKNYYDEAHASYFGWLPAIPHGSVAGTIAYDGEKHRVSGSGYHDHNWGNIGLEQVMDHWYWGRLHLGQFTAIFVEMTASRAYGFQKLPVFMLAHHDRILTGEGKPLTLQLADWQRHPQGRNYPRRLDFQWQSPAGTVSIALRNPKVVEAATLLGHMPRWQQHVVRLFANPYYFRFQADVDLRVDLGGIQAGEHGQTLYELMLLR